MKHLLIIIALHLIVNASAQPKIKNLIGWKLNDATKHIQQWEISEDCTVNLNSFGGYDFHCSNKNEFSVSFEHNAGLVTAIIITGPEGYYQDYVESINKDVPLLISYPEGALYCDIFIPNEKNPQFQLKLDNKRFQLIYTE